MSGARDSVLHYTLRKKAIAAGTATASTALDFFTALGWRSGGRNFYRVLKCLSSRSGSTTGLFTYLRKLRVHVSDYSFAAHVRHRDVFGGMVGMLGDFRLLGISMRKLRCISDPIDQLRIPKRYGAPLMITCGVLLAGSKAEEYYYNAFFRVKVILLLCVFLHGWVFRKSVYQNTKALDAAPQIPAVAKVAAATSLLLWIGLVICGRGIGYIEPPLDKIHADARPGILYTR